MQLAKEFSVCEKRAAIDILVWVDENLPKIKGHARKYLAYSPYELEEFIQSAYEAAILAERCEGYEYEQAFWFHFKKSCLNMTYSHGNKKIKCFHEEYREFGDDDNPPTYIKVQPKIDDTINFTLSDVVGASIIRDALEIMTNKEKEVWELLLKGLGLKRTATYLGKSKTAVIKLRDAGKKRAVKQLLFFPQEFSTGIFYSKPFHYAN